MKRYLLPFIETALNTKIVLLMGPRQTGKTTLSKKLVSDFEYFSYDAAEDRLALQEKTWDRKKSLIIFDELHKMKDWKRWLKGIYDKEGVHPALLVTGSAKLDAYRKMGDSLAGRYFQYRLHPLDLKEAAHYTNYHQDDIFNRLWHCGGFPEPFIKGEETYYKLWRQTHLDIILRQDLLDMYAVRDIQSIETLIQLLKKRVGSPISYANLANDLGRDATTIKRWLQLLENLYLIFPVTPYHKNIARALLKAPKYYFYDIAQAEGNGSRLENMVAASLLKELHFINDTTGSSGRLHYMRTKEGREIDFVICVDDHITHCIEVKESDDTPSPAFQKLSALFKKAKCIQLVKNIRREKTYPDGLDVRSLISWLSSFKLQEV